MFRGLFTIGLCLVAFLAFGCKELKPAASQNEPKVFPEDGLSVNLSGKTGGRIVTAMLGDPSGFNPILASDADAQALNQIMGAGLTRLNLKTQEPEPALAKSWETNSDQRTWTFHLRQNLNWSDGHPFTASDVLFTMQIVNDPEIPSGAQDVLSILGKKIQWSQKDDFTVVATLPDQYGPFLRFIDGGTVPILPKHKWQKVYESKKFAEAMQLNMNPADFVTMGAFHLKEYKPGEKISLARNPHYWKKDNRNNRLPYLEEITFLILGGQDQLLLRLVSGDVDTYQSIRPQDLSQLLTSSDATQLEVLPLGASYENEQLFFNQNGGKNPKTGEPYLLESKRKWFTDVNFRKAISHSIDRESIARNAMFGKASPVYGAESPNNQLWYCDGIKKYEYDLQKAQALLTDSGFKRKTMPDGSLQLIDRNGNPVRFSLLTNAGNTTRNTQCSLIVSDLAKVGIVVDYSAVDFGTLVEKVTESFQYDAAVLSLTHDDIDPAAAMNLWLSSGTLHFWWPGQVEPATEWEKRIDELMNLQLMTFDPSKRKAYYDEVQKILAEQQPIIFTANQFLHACAKRSIGNLQPAIARHRTLWNADELYWKN